MTTKTARPTPVNKALYVKFGNKCRTNGREVNEVLSSLLQLYLKEGEQVFRG